MPCYITNNIPVGPLTWVCHKVALMTESMKTNIGIFNLFLALKGSFLYYAGDKDKMLNFLMSKSIPRYFFLA